MKKSEIALNGVLKENPVFVLALGTCPTLAVTTSLSNALGMGIAAAAVLICSNTVISVLKKLIPDSIRIPFCIVIIAGFVTAVEMLMQAYFPALYESLGIYIPLIVVNCIILGKAEMFALKNSVSDSFTDGVFSGLGFIIALALMGAVREILGSGSILGYDIGTPGIKMFAEVPGGFLVYGIIAALVGTVNHCCGCNQCRKGE